MTRILTFVEIDVPSFSSPPAATTFSFVEDTFVPFGNIGGIPSLTDLTIDPATVSLGEDLGVRATVTAKFRDHRYSFAGEPFYQGTFWGKFRARYGLTLRGAPLRVITMPYPNGAVETRHFVIESSNGPSTKGEYQIIAKDVLKLADGDRSQAPVLSNGFLVADITSSATSATLSPSGIGNAEYPASGLLAIGGSEIVSFTRAGDVLTITRAQANTAAVAHTAQDRVQRILQYAPTNPANIINDLLVNYAGIASGFINLTNWQNEITTYLNTVYSAIIAEPTSVATLVSELIEQVGLAIWWDDIGQQLRLQVLRPIPSTADTFDQFNIMADSLQVTEQPNRQLTQVYTYFGKINPLVNEDQINNYRSTSFQIDAAAEAAYGASVIKKIYSRWIAAGGRAVADSLGAVLLARFRDPPRRIAFDLLRGSVTAPAAGVGYRIGGWLFQNQSGAAVTVPGQITRLNPKPDVYSVEVEEISSTAFAVASPGDHVLIIDANIYNVNLRTMHDSVYGTPVSGNTVTCTINPGVIVGSANTAIPAFDVGTWPAGVTVKLVNSGRIEGIGGAGGSSRGVGQSGGLAFFTRQAITVTPNEIWGGGGGGGCGSSAGPATNGGASGGGGGAGQLAGSGGLGVIDGIFVGNNGNPGTATAGGTGGVPGSGGTGGTGGGPGLAGAAGTGPFGATAGGAAGTAIDGVSHISFIGGGDIRGAQIN